MLYMVIETFHPGKAGGIYERFDKKGRLLPDGVLYINSWIDMKIQTCYQVMEADSEKKLLPWINRWKYLADFEVVPVMTSKEAKSRIDNR